jgi:hypothetical protein
MEGGSTHVFSDPEGLRIRAGNGGNLQVSFAGKTEDLGANGKISERTFANKVSKNVSISSSTDEDQNTTKTADTSGTTKKTAASEKSIITKKSLAATSTKRSTSTSSTGLDHKQDIAHKYGASEGINSEKRALDVPYRYSE